MQYFVYNEREQTSGCVLTTPSYETALLWARTWFAEELRNNESISRLFKDIELFEMSDEDIIIYAKTHPLLFKKIDVSNNNYEVRFDDGTYVRYYIKSSDK